MSPRCLIVIALASFCGGAQVQAKPLSFNGVQVPQKWDAFLKAHPKAEVFLPSDVDLELTRAQQLAKQLKRKESLLVESFKGRAFPDALYFFQDGSLSQFGFVTDPSFRVRKERKLADLKEPLRKLFAELGRPTAQGVTLTEFGNAHRPVLVWKTPTQCAFACVEWPLVLTDPALLAIEVHIINAPWRARDINFKTKWPALLSPNREDEMRLKALSALMERLKPGSTLKVETLKPAPVIDLFSLEKTEGKVLPSPSGKAKATIELRR